MLPGGAVLHFNRLALPPKNRSFSGHSWFFILTNIKRRGNMSQITTVLIVDDDDVFLKITESMVKMLGYPVMTAGDGVEAIEIFKKHAYEIGCVVLDIHMPRMNGIETLQNLREIRENVQVLIASGYLIETNLAQLTPLQPAGYLKKPVSFDTFSEILKKCLEDESSSTLK